MNGRASIVAALVIFLATAVPGTALSQADEEAELADVRARIEALESKLATEVRRRSDGAAELRRVELDLAAAEKTLARIDSDIRGQERRQAAIAADERDADARLLAEREALAEQVRMSYMTGRQEMLKLLLSQESPADVGRMLTYYDYLNRARGERIESVGSELAALEGLATASRAAREELERLRSSRAGELAALERARGERQAVLVGLEASIADAGSQIERLHDEEDRLTELISELSTLMARLPGDTEAPFASLRGQLSWPVEGRIRSDFGELREGGALRWNGVVLEAPAGTIVRAIYHGRVAFADWLPGLGLLLILDHGDGYMSLYGHNEALLREPGTWVSPGEAVAQVGDTGGQSRPALYFEIRRDGEPQNPHDWVN